MGGVRRLRLAAGLGAAGLATAVALTGCGSGDSGGDKASSGVAADEGARQVAPGAAEAQPQEKPLEGQGAPADLRVDQRSIVYTGSITVRVKDVEREAARAVSIVTAAGGFVGGDKRTTGDSHAEASLVLRVPADKFGAVVDEIAGLGDQERRDITTQDVTEELLDLDARITSQRARVDSGRRLLAQAKTLSDLVMLEGELAKREADLASLEAKKRRLGDLTALSTITAVLLGPDARPVDDEPQIGFLAGLKAGWKAFVASFRVLLTVLGALLPWIIALGLPVVGVLWLARRLGRRPPPVPVTPPAPSGRPAPPAAD